MTGRRNFIKSSLSVAALSMIPKNILNKMNLNNAGTSADLYAEPAKQLNIYGNKVFIFVLLGGIIISCAKLSKRALSILSEDVKPPILLERIEPVYPQEAQSKGFQGDVHLYLLISDSGEVKQSKIARSSGFKLLDNEAIDYAKKLKFDPARRNGKPINIWITWEVKYKLASVETYNVPLEYVRKIKHLFQLAERSGGEEKKRVLQKILDAHDSFIKRLDENSDLNYNMYIQEFVDPQVYHRWRDLWQDLPLRFAVFDDFILRYPESDKASYAITRLLALIKDDIVGIKELAQYKPGFGEKKDLFLKTTYNFLNEKYPQAITEDMRQEAEMYLKKE